MAFLCIEHLTELKPSGARVCTSGARIDGIYGDAMEAQVTPVAVSPNPNGECSGSKIGLDVRNPRRRFSTVTLGRPRETY